MAAETSRPAMATKPQRIMKIDRKKLAEYKRLGLVGLFTLCIVGVASRFDQWLTEHKTVYVEMSVGYLVAGCLILLFSRDRTRIAAASFGLVVVLGSVNAVLSRNFVAMPLILGCAIAFTGLVW
jgi:hypothetical protein